MELLPPDKSHVLKNLVKPLTHHLLLTSILEGKTQSTIYVDDEKNPKSALLWVKRKAYLLGKPENRQPRQIEELVESKYYEYLRKHYANSFIVFYNEECKPFLDNMFTEQNKHEYVRSYYYLETNTQIPIAFTPPNIRIIPITEELIASPYVNVELVKEEMCSERYTIDDFLEKSFGYVALDGDEIVSWCMSEYNSDSRCELGIATVEEYQRRGYASSVAAAVIDHAKEIGITEIGWHCWKENIPSVQTALKIGFTHKKDYHIIHISI